MQGESQGRFEQSGDKIRACPNLSYLRKWLAVLSPHAM
jgi:hypothetical protein